MGQPTFLQRNAVDLFTWRWLASWLSEYSITRNYVELLQKGMEGCNKVPSIQGGSRMSLPYLDCREGVARHDGLLSVILI